MEKKTIAENEESGSVCKRAASEAEITGIGGVMGITMCTIRFTRLAIDSALISFRSRGRRMGRGGGGMTGAGGRAG